MVGRVTPGVRDACTGKALERDTPGRRGGVSPRAHGHRGRREGAIPYGGFRGGASGRSSDVLIVHIMKQRSTEYGQLRLFSTNKNGDPKAAAVFTQ